MVLYPLPRPVSPRFQRSATRPALEATDAVARVSVFDGHTHVLAVRTSNGWQRSGRLPWTMDTVESLRGGEVREVLLSRRFRRARVSMAWLPELTH